MISTLSDKALLEMARRGEREAAAMLLKRWCCRPDSLDAVVAEWKKGRPSVSAAKRIAALAGA